MKTLIHFIILGLLVSCGQKTTVGTEFLVSSSNVIFGQFDLVSANRAPRDRLIYAQSVALKITNIRVTNTTNGDHLDLSRARTYRENNNGHVMCPGEPLIDEKIFGSCTGFLIGKNILMTAAHCLGETEDEARTSGCPKNSWAFGLTDDKISSLPLRDVYKCNRVLAYNGGDDYALIVLERERNTAPILKLTSERVTSRDHLYNFSYPLGTALKYTDSVEFDHYSSDMRTLYYKADLYGGTSGSPVFNQNNEVVALHRASTQVDFKMDSNLNCEKTVVGEDDDYSKSRVFSKETLNKINSLL